MRPPIPYFGGKIRLADRLVDLMSRIPHEHYVEPYCGSLAVLLAKPPVTHETVNDLDRHLVTFWRVLRDRTEDLVRVCELTPHARVEQSLAIRLDQLASGLDDLEVARLIWVALTQGRAGTRTTTGWRHYQDPGAGRTGMPGYLDGYVGRMNPVVNRIHRVSLECRPALDVIRDYGRHPRCLLYVDPPYLGSTRCGGSHAQDTDRRHARDAYAVEMKSPAEHEALAEALHECRAGIVLSGYPSPLYEALYADWCRTEFTAATGQGGRWEERTEVVWSNRNVSAPDLFDIAEVTA